MNNRFLRLLQVNLAAMDFIAINAVFFTAEYLFRTASFITANIEYVYFGFSLNVAWAFITLAVNVYHERNILSFTQYSKVTARAFVYFLLVVVCELFFFRFLLLSRVFILTVLAIIMIMVLINRMLYLLIYEYFKKHNHIRSKVIVIGYNGLSKKLADYLTEDGINKEIVGFCDEFENIKELSRYPILSDISGTLEACKKYGVKEIYCTIAPENNPGVYQIIQEAEQNCIRFKMIPDLGVFMKRNIHIGFLNEIPVLSLRKEPLDDLGNRIKKRAFDIAISFIAVVFVLSWLIPLLALIIKLTSKGPVFFSQLRTGKDNKAFYCYKFRSMRVNSSQHLQQATRNDSRITAVGRFLRKTNLDEFPQFWNVLKGDMSIAGPRPHMLKHTDEYAALIGQYMVRQFLKPGITGWAQVNGFRGETRTLNQMQDRVEHDLWYLENWSLLLDMKITFLTFFNTVRGERNAF